jgi:hypothetical protein
MIPIDLIGCLRPICHEMLSPAAVIASAVARRHRP